MSELSAPWRKALASYQLVILDTEGAGGFQSTERCLQLGEGGTFGAAGSRSQSERLRPVRIGTLLGPQGGLRKQVCIVVSKGSQGLDHLGVEH